MDSIQGSFKLPFNEQIAFFLQKLNLPTKTYKDLQAHAHDKAFTVAGAMKADLLTDLHTAVGKAITDGETLLQFRQRFDDIVKKHGWAGWTGSSSTAGKAWRTRIIYDTNLRTSHAAGRWQQMTTPDMLAMRPFWQYIHTTLDNPRLNHKRIDGMVRRADDPWWRINYPPNDWGCGCYVRTLSAYDVQRLNLTVLGIDENAGIIAGTGWQHAAGSTWQPDLSKYPTAIASDLKQSLGQ